MGDIKALKQQVLDMTLRCHGEALFAGTSGNLSVITEEGVMAITPTSVEYHTMKAEDIVLMKPDGTIIEGHYAPSSEWRLHAQIYLHRPNVKSVIHTHSPYATSFAVVRRPVPLVLIEMVAFLGGEVPVAEFAIPGTDGVGLNAVAAMEGGRVACVMANHGVVATGDNLEQAHIRAVYVEDAAKIATLAAANGTPITITPAEQQAMLDVIAKAGQ